MLFLFPPCFFPCLFLSFFFPLNPIASNCMHSSKPLFIMIRIHTLKLCDDWGSGWSDLYVELLTKNNVRINELYFSKRPLLSFRSQENCCNCYHHFEYAVIELSSFSRTPDRFYFPRRVQAYQFHCGRSFVSSNPPPSPEHRFSFLIPQDTAGWSTKLFPFLDMSTNFFISFCLFVTLQR